MSDPSSIDPSSGAVSGEPPSTDVTSGNPVSSSEMTEKERELRSLIGRTISDRYRITELIGTGGMGAVYEAEHIGIGKKVAVKFISKENARENTVAGRFAREARAASAVESEHIVSVFDAGTDDGRPFIVMELLRGEDFGARLRRLGKIPPEEAMHVIAQVLRGLADAHEAGIIHRDLKPDNVFLIDKRGDASFVKVVDFGVSKIERPEGGTAPLALTKQGTVVGTPYYMSPEQAQAAPDLDARADLFSVGAMLFESLAGRPPHVGNTYEAVIVSICMNDAPDLKTLVPEVSSQLARFVARALARDRKARFSSARQMLVALSEFAPRERMSGDEGKAASSARSRSSGDALEQTATPSTKPSPQSAQAQKSAGRAAPARRGLRPIASRAWCRRRRRRDRKRRSSSPESWRRSRAVSRRRCCSRTTCVAPRPIRQPAARPRPRSHRRLRASRSLPTSSRLRAPRRSRRHRLRKRAQPHRHRAPHRRPRKKSKRRPATERKSTRRRSQKATSISIAISPSNAAFLDFPARSAIGDNLGRCADPNALFSLPLSFF